MYHIDLDSATNKIKRKLLILSHEFARFNFDFYLCAHIAIDEVLLWLATFRFYNVRFVR